LGRDRPAWFGETYGSMTDVSHELDNKVVVCTIRSPRICGAERDSLYRARAGTDGTSRDRGRAVCELGGCKCHKGVALAPGVFEILSASDHSARKY
jgi:hypothetical protein